MREVTRPDHGQPWDVDLPDEDVSVSRWLPFGPEELDFLLHVLGGYQPRHGRERTMSAALRCQILDQLNERA